MKEFAAGIPVIFLTASQLTQMYDVFYQADPGSSRLAGGLGRGLPIAQAEYEENPAYYEVLCAAYMAEHHAAKADIMDTVRT